MWNEIAVLEIFHGCHSFVKTEWARIQCLKYIITLTGKLKTHAGALKNLSISQPCPKEPSSPLCSLSMTLCLSFLKAKLTPRPYAFVGITIALQSNTQHSVSSQQGICRHISKEHWKGSEDESHRLYNSELSPGLRLLTAWYSDEKYVSPRKFIRDVFGVDGTDILRVNIVVVLRDLDFSLWKKRVGCCSSCIVLTGPSTQRSPQAAFTGTTERLYVHRSCFPCTLLTKLVFDSEKNPGKEIWQV